MKRPNILITGGNFTNQGAYLMLVATADAIRTQLHSQPVISIQTGTERSKRWIGLDSLLSIPRIGFVAKGGNRETFRRVKNRLPFVFSSDIDAVLDISGFVFSDEWEHLDLEKRAAELGWWSQRDVPVYLLPQAFGPLVKTSGSARRVVDLSRIVYARDKYSYSHLETAGCDMNKVLLAPDFTTVLEGEVPLAAPSVGDFAIVPNWNIYKRAASTADRDRYLPNLRASAAAARKIGLKPFGLSHEGKEDVELLQMASDGPSDLPVVTGLNGLESKWLLAHCELVLSGRFHAIVSAMSSGVPALMHGWSHKYAALAEDFGVSSMQMDPFCEPSETKAKVVEIAQNRDAVVGPILHHGNRQRLLTESMWSDIRLDFFGGRDVREGENE